MIIPQHTLEALKLSGRSPDFTCKVWRFKPDTGKYYDELEFAFSSNSFTAAIDDLRVHQRDHNGSRFIYVVNGEGTLKNIHPKLIK